MGYRESIADSYVHIYNRGVKKMPIYREKGDLLRLFYSLYYFNTSESMPENWMRDVIKEGGPQTFVWPTWWDTRTPIVSILACTIMSNHFHLLLKEKVEGGVSKFMHRTSMGYSKFINEKYEESGSLFQGRYKSRRIDTDTDLKNLAVYIMVKNPFEMYPDGLMSACAEFDKAYAHSLAYPLTSLAEFTEEKPAAVLDHDLLHQVYEESPEFVFKEFARECMEYRLEQLSEYDF